VRRLTLGSPKGGGFLRGQPPPLYSSVRSGRRGQGSNQTRGSRERGEGEGTPD